MKGSLFERALALHAVLVPGDIYSHSNSGLKARAKLWKSPMSLRWRGGGLGDLTPFVLVVSV